MSPDTKALLDAFIAEQRLSVIATRGPAGSIHPSVMHYSTDPTRRTFFFSTDDRSVKVASCLRDQGAAVAIGWSEETWVTVQMRGEVTLLSSPEEIQAAKAVHYQVHPNSRRFENDPHTVFLAFRPKWIRYSDLGVEPALIEEEDLA
jgi:general stress protein 26